MGTQEKEEAVQNEAKAVRQVAHGLQTLLIEHGSTLTDGLVPSVVMYRANVNPGKPDEVLQWHAGIVYLQHVSPNPKHALQALGQTLMGIIQKLKEDGVISEEPDVMQLPGGEAVITLPNLGDENDG